MAAAAAAWVFRGRCIRGNVGRGAAWTVDNLVEEVATETLCRSFFFFYFVLPFRCDTVRLPDLSSFIISYVTCSVMSALQDQIDIFLGIKVLINFHNIKAPISNAFCYSKALTLKFEPSCRTTYKRRSKSCRLTHSSSALCDPLSLSLCFDLRPAPDPFQSIGRVQRKELR